MSAASNYLFRHDAASPSVSLLLLSFIQLALWQSIVLSFTLSFTPGPKSPNAPERTSISSPGSRRVSFSRRQTDLPFVWTASPIRPHRRPGYTLQYSPNFQRHIVRRNHCYQYYRYFCCRFHCSYWRSCRGKFSGLDQISVKVPSAKLFAVGMELASSDENASAKLQMISTTTTVDDGGRWLGRRKQYLQPSDSMSAQYPVHFISMTQPDEQAAHGSHSAVVRSVLKLFPRKWTSSDGGTLSALRMPRTAQERLAFLLAPLLPTFMSCNRSITRRSIGLSFISRGRGRNVRGSSIARTQGSALAVAPTVTTRHWIWNRVLKRRLSVGRTGCDCRHSIVSPSLRTDTVRGNGNGSSAVGSVVDSCPSAAGSSGGLLALEGMGWTQWQSGFDGLPGIVTPSEEVGWNYWKMAGAQRYELQARKVQPLLATTIASGTRERSMPCSRRICP
jgi:hypothetical protein